MRSIAAIIFGAAVLACPALASLFVVTSDPDLAVTTTSPVCHTAAPQPFTSATACAGGSVGVMGSAGQPGGGFPQGFSEANSQISDLMISGPGSSVTMTVTIPFTSILTEEFETFPAGGSSASGRIAFSIVSHQYQGSIGFSTNGDDDTGQPTVAGTGWSYSLVPTFDVTILTGPSGVGAIHNTSFQFNGSLTFTASFPVGVFFPINLDVQGACSAGGLNLNAFPSNCQYDALDPFGFVAGFSSFDLPPGYSVNAASIGLVDGQIVSSAVPEPSMIVLLALGCVMLLTAQLLQSRGDTMTFSCGKNKLKEENG